MYRDMRVNGPVQIMDYPDFPFRSPISYTHHSKVLEYLHDYAAHFNLLPCIRFQQTLLKISRVENGRTISNQAGWSNPGRYSAPNWPPLEGLNLFSGSVIHSHDYRFREPYIDKRKVVVIGAGPSGIDMALDVASVATEVIFLNRSWNEDEDTVEGIYRHLINISQPSMALLSVSKPTLSFPLYHQQILYFIKTLIGTVQLPTKERMVAEMKEDIEHRKSVYGLKAKDRHLLKSLPLMRAYFELLERDGNLEPTKPVVYKLLEEIIRTRTADPVGYKAINYRLIDDERFEQKGG
ncbi:hypothetical protein TYRP_015102 [Tyrophagus putrescentiae]|nr:hypothetical protein TYRP_015102 [Tyrophagus putrescentiae]